MTTLRDKFNDRRWVDKRDAVLERAEYACEYCETDHDLEVHICYWVKGKEPWDLPDDAYRCYCPLHKQMRQRVEIDIRVLLAAFSVDELDAWHLTIKELAKIPRTSRGPRVERMYVAAKNERDDYEKSESRIDLETN